MLVLSRHRDETVMIGDEIELTVVDIRGDKVRLGIKAPTRVPVHRKEVYESIRRENQRAGDLDDPSIGTVRPGTTSRSARTAPIAGKAVLLAATAAPTGEGGESLGRMSR